MKKYYIVCDLTVDKFSVEDKFFIVHDSKVLESIKRHPEIYHIPFSSSDKRFVDSIYKAMSSYSENCYAVIQEKGKEHFDYYPVHYKDMKQIVLNPDKYEIIGYEFTEDEALRTARELYNI